MNNLSDRLRSYSINQSLMGYDLIKGTKYKLGRCTLLIGAMGMLGGFSVYMLTDKSKHKYLIPAGVTLGAGATTVLLARKTYRYSLKPVIISRVIENIKSIVQNKIEYNNNTESKMFDKVANYLCNIDQSRSRVFQERAALKGKSRDILQQHLAYESAFHNMTDLIEKSIYENWDLKFLTPEICALAFDAFSNDAKVINDAAKVVINDAKVINYSKALAYIQIFTNQQTYTQALHDALITNLTDLIPYEEMMYIHNILLTQGLNIPKKIPRELGPFELRCANHNHLAAKFMEKIKEISKNTTKIQTQHDLKTDSNGKIKFLTCEELIAYMAVLNMNYL